MAIAARFAMRFGGLGSEGIVAWGEGVGWEEVERGMVGMVPFCCCELGSRRGNPSFDICEVLCGVG